MVELEAMTEEESLEIFSLIKDHYYTTDSTKAMSILENWEKQQKSFIKVMPIEYKRALARMAEEQKVQQTV
jgi:glutamate synthase (ferredoxin)